MAEEIIQDRPMMPMTGGGQLTPQEVSDLCRLSGAGNNQQVVSYALQ